MPLITALKRQSQSLQFEAQVSQNYMMRCVSKTRHKPHTCNSITGEPEAGRSEFRVTLKLKASVDYIRLCLKKKGRRRGGREMGRGCIDLSVNIWLHLPLHETADEADRVFTLSMAIIGWTCPQSPAHGAVMAARAHAEASQVLLTRRCSHLPQ